MKHSIPIELCSGLKKDKFIFQKLESVIWFGSIRNNQDVHERSDYDIQIVLSEPDTELILRLNRILINYPNIDLSIMYMHDIYDENGKVIYHDGTKGLFFMYVLANGKLLYGRNVYKSALDSLTLKDIQPSILITIREYLSRLRVMAAQSPNDTMQFKKYSLKLFKDILLYLGTIPLNDIPRLNNATAKNKIAELYQFSNESNKALEAITDYEHNFSQEELATLLNDYEKIVGEVLHV
jgi:hypothetical protein